VYGPHAHCRLWVAPGHHPGITRGRVNLATLARGGAASQVARGKVPSGPKTACPSSAS
jgi:hypothetical protein